ncbi:hypothetical protein FH972_022954 [Carpinus fangiana]|uniref:F-box domain-containing protein n=1 Tax=Carpinus fangiana TaxID=176857 RepID=A0A5N6KTS4_9ROSI|nr:hypothetical protein FH972_022954 [Carpinus fangiana]
MRTFLRTSNLHTVTRLFSKGYAALSNSERPFPNASLFATLPVELWQLIAALLPLSSQVSLTLSCTSLYRCFGNVFLQRIRRNMHEKMSFLQLSGDKNSWQWFCFRCQTYHKTFNWLANWNDQCKSFSNKYGSAMLNLKDKKIYFWQVQSAARVGRFGTEFGLAMSDYERFGGDGWRYTFSTVFVDDHLLVNFTTTKRCRLDSVMHESFEPGVNGNAYKSAQCGHFWDEIEDNMWCAISHLINPQVSPEPCQTCGELLLCQTCATEYIIRAKAVGRGGCQLSISRWSDWGDGMSPYSKEWQAATDPEYYDRTGRAFDLPEEHSVRSRFVKAKDEPVGVDGEALQNCV